MSAAAARRSRAPRGEPLEVSARALRVVLVLALDRASVASCLGAGRAEGHEVWPSTLYAWAAEAAARSPRVWERCARAIDAALGGWVSPYEDASAARIAELLRLGDAAMTGEEIAAALWTLVRRREPGLARITERLAGEVEVQLARACLGAPCGSRRACA